MLRSRLGLAAAAVTFAVALVGCGGTVPTSGDTESATADPSTGTTSGDPPVEDTSSPPVEDTDSPEDPETEQDENIALELPGLPIGGSSREVPGSNTLQCAELNWSGPPDIPDGIEVTVSAIAFEPAAGFAEAREGCSGESGLPLCRGSGYAFTATFSQCSVPVTWTGSPTLNETRLIHFTAGRILCPAGRIDECDRFRDDIAAHGGEAVPLDPAPSEFETDQTDEDPGEDPGEDPAEDPGEDPGGEPSEDPGGDPSGDPGETTSESAPTDTAS